jgi:menaquinone-dependent protoporphyrinogen IX oxidase
MPDLIYHVAGAIHDRQLNLIERAILHAIVDSKGVERHPSGDTELTDWAALDDFVRSFEALVQTNVQQGVALPEREA